MNKKSDKIIFLQPVMKEVLWGGKRLMEEFGYDIPSEHTGECWAVSAHEKGDCKIESGLYKETTLSELWDDHRELFGNMDYKKFPLLVKIIDAKKDLSIQVHPNDSYASVNEGGALGKTECWYILDCDKDASIIIGHNAKNKKEVESMIQNGEWSKFIREVPIKKGDFFQINPGTVHSIKAGTLLLETQQNSDITYRVYDYDRKINGKLRELHIDKSIDVIEAPYVEMAQDKRSDRILGDMVIQKLVECPYYVVELQKLKGTVQLQQDKDFRIYSVVDGEGTIDEVPIKKGMHFILPSEYEEYCINGEIELVCSYI